MMNNRKKISVQNLGFTVFYETKGGGMNGAALGLYPFNPFH